MGQTYSVTTTDSEQEALEWVAAQTLPPTDPAEYFDARVHELLANYERQHAVNTAVAPVEDVAVAYAKADAATQHQVATTLGVETPKT